MLSINTNLSNLLMQKSLKESTNLLNQAVERMTTGFKINGAKDNAANHAIVQQMNTQLSSLDVAEDNTATGLDLVTTANDNLDLINERFERLRNLAMQVENETYGADSKSAINVECEALVEEIKNLYRQAEFNGMKIYGAEFFETVPTTPTEPIQTFANTPIYANANTTLQELGIDYSSFEIYNSEGGLIESYDTEKSDTLQDIFDVLSNYGFNSSITDGVISITSSSGRYVAGDLMEKFGINLDETQFIESSRQNSDSAVYYTTTVTASESSTFADMGVLTSGTDTVTIKDKFGDVLTSFNVNSSTTLGGLFNQLGNYDIQGEVDDGVITLSSSKGNYVVSSGVISSLGIGLNQSTSAVTTGTTQSSAGVVTYESITMSGGEVTTTQQEVITTIWTTTTTFQTVTNTIWTTTTTSQTYTETIWTTTTTSQTETNTIWTTTTTSTTQTLTVTETIQVETTTVTTTETVSTIYSSQSEVLQIVVKDISNKTYTDEEVAAMTAIQSVSSFTSGQKYKIETAADLAYLATRVNAGASHTGAIFVLANDINLSSYSNWTPIGNSESNRFEEAVFDGNGHVIKNLKINSANSELGLFGETFSVTIQNTGLENININTAQGAHCSAGVVGIALLTTIKNCYVTGSIYAEYYTGGIIGGALGDIYIENCYTDLSITTGRDTTDAAGIIGYTSDYDGITIINCYTEGEISGEGRGGGLVADLGGTYLIKNSYSTSNISCAGTSGGLINRLSIQSTEGTIRDCYTTGTISNGNGLVGSFTNYVGYQNDYYFYQCYSVQSDSAFGVQKTEAEILSASNLKTMGYTYKNGWGIVDNEPILYWQEEANVIPPSAFIATTATTFDELGLTGGYVYYSDGTRSSSKLTAASTISDLINLINNSGKNLSAELVDGVITVIANGSININTTYEANILYKNIFKTLTLTEIANYNTTTTTTTQTILVDKEQDKTVYNTVYTTTTSSTTNTSTVWNTTTSSATQTNTIYTTTTSSTTNTSTVWNTTTSSATNTETIDITTTTPIIYTTANISITSDTTFSELGLSSRSYITVMKDDTKTIITLKTADTVQDLVTKLNSSGITTTLNNGQLTLSPNSKSKYISGMSDSLIDIFKLESDFYTSSLGMEMTDSNLLVNDDAVITINQSTSLSEIGVTSGELVVKQDGNDDKTIAISESQSVADFVADLQNAGFNASCVNGAIKLSSNGDRYLASSSTNSSNAVSIFGLNNVEQEIGVSYANTNSDELSKVDEIVNVIWKASSPIRLQIGTGSDEHSRIEIETGFTILDLDKFARIGKNMVNKIDFISELDVVLNTISEKQVELGAYSNRLESVLEEISIKYDNLVSSRSTLRDADIAEESAIYIQQQILQQAAATLMATTANQTPQLALQLI